MRQFAAYYPDFEIVPQLPWGHISVSIHKAKDDSIRSWYAEQTIQKDLPSVEEIEAELNEIENRDGKF